MITILCYFNKNELTLPMLVIGTIWVIVSLSSTLENLAPQIPDNVYGGNRPLETRAKTKVGVSCPCMMYVDSINFFSLIVFNGTEVLLVYILLCRPSEVCLQ
jgi:hypothetical protein